MNKLFATGPDQNKPLLRKIIEAKTHFNLSHIKHEFKELHSSDKLLTFLNSMREIILKNPDVSMMVFCNSVK